MAGLVGARAASPPSGEKIASVQQTGQPMSDIQQKLRILFRDRRVHSHRRFLRAGQLRRKHRGFAEDRHAAFADFQRDALMPALDRDARRVFVGRLAEGFRRERDGFGAEEGQDRLAALDLKRRTNRRVSEMPKARQSESDLSFRLARLRQ